MYDSFWESCPEPGFRESLECQDSGNPSSPANPPLQETALCIRLMEAMEVSLEECPVLILSQTKALS